MTFDEVWRFSNYGLTDITPEPETTPGVYFLLDRVGDVVYVGQSIVPRSRVIQHRQDRKEFEEARLLSVREKDLDEVELAFIHLFAPPLNERVGKMEPAHIAKVVRRYGIEADEHAIKPHRSLTGPVRLADAAKRAGLSEDDFRAELNAADVRIRYSPSLDCLVVGKNDLRGYLEKRERRHAKADAAAEVA